MAGQFSRKSKFVFLFALIVVVSISCVPLFVGAYMPSSTATSTVVAADQGTVTLGDTVTFTATVTATTGTATGLVTFFDGNTPIGSAILNQQNPNQAALSTSLLSAAGSPHSITAKYQGDATHDASTSPAISETVNPRTSTTSPLVLNPNTVVVGQPSTATVTVTDSGSVPPGTADSFATTGAPVTGRTGFTSTLFADGMVLVAGGTGADAKTVLNSAEIYNASPTPGFIPTGNLNTARTGAVAVLLPNGKVLVAGGSSNGLATGALNTAELFDPSVGTFIIAGANSTPANQMQAARFGATATLLNTGEVLIAGGQDATGTVLNTAELYDPAADTFTASTGTLNTARTGHSATLLGTGKVLVAGGSSDGTANGALNSAELFDPGAGTFTAITGANSTLTANRWQPEAALLLSGKVLIAGGQNSGGALANADLYDPVANTFTAGNHSMSQARANGSAVSLPNGMVLLAGGTTSQAVDLYDPESDTFDTTGNLQQSDSGLVSTLLNNGDVLVIGLTTATLPASDAELYAPSFNPLGTVDVTSSEGTDSITGSCTLTPSTSTASTCTSTVTPVNVATSPHTITGAYPKPPATTDGVHSTSSNTASLSVTPASTNTGVASSSNPSIFGQAITFTATVTDTSAGSTAQPTGSIQFVVDGINFGAPVALAGASSNSSSATSQATAALSVSGSPHTVTANYVNADGNFTNSSGALTGGQTVTAANTATTVHSSQNPSAFGQAVTFTATVTDSSAGSTAQPTGAVQFVVDGVNFGSPVTLTGASSNSSSALSQAIATLSVAGSPHTVTANFVNADGNFSNSTGSLSGGQTVTAASTTTTVASSSNPSSFGQPITFTATVTDSSSGSTAQPTGAVQFVVDGINFGPPVALTGASSNSSSATSQATAALPVTGSPHTVSANFVNADGSFTNSTGLLSGGQTVAAANTATTVQSSQNPSTFGQSVTFTATVTDVSAGSVAVPTGSVQFVVDGVNFGSPVALTTVTSNSSSAMSQAIATLSVGGSPHSVTVNFVNVDGNFNNSTGLLSGGQIVTAAATSTTVASSVNPSAFGQSVTFTATVTNNSTSPAPTGAVQFVIDGVNAGSPVAVIVGTDNTSTAAFSTSTLTVPGSPHSVTANFVNADGNFSNSTGTLSGGQTVTAAATSTIVTASLSATTLGDTVTLTATVSVNSPGTGTPTGLVTFFDGTTPIGNGTLNQTSPDQASFSTSLLAVGSHSITAIYDGDANFSVSPLSSAITETVSLRTSTTAVALNPLTVVVGQPSTTTVTVTDGGSSTPPGTADSFTTTGAPATSRTGFTSTLFADGLVLVAGGTDAGNNVLNSAEIYSVSNGTFRSTGNLNAARTGAVAVLLPNGKVLVAGGSNDGTANGALNTAELFNPATGTFTLTSQNMTAARFGMTATLLSTGKVLIAGGQNSGGVLNSAELYDPATDTFIPSGNLNTARTGHSATLLGTGKVLVAGGSSDGTANGALNSGEVFDPAGNSGAGTFTAITGANSTLAAGRWQPEAALLLSGKALLAGGQNSGGALASADLYDPVANSFTPSSHSMTQARANGSAVSLPNGMVLLAGGTTSQSVDLYDADNDKFDTTGSLQQSDNGLVATLLNNGDVLVVGLTTDATPASDAELYAPSFNPLGTVAVTSSEGTDSITGACVLTPSTSTASTCTSAVTPANVATSPHTITGTYPADTVHSGSTNTANLTVNPAATTTTVSSSSNPSIFGQSITFTATVTDSSSGSTAIPTGSVQFVVDGVNFGSPVTLTGSSSNSSTATSQATATLSVGGSPHTVQANFVNADGNFTSSSGSLTPGQTITPASTLTSVASSLNPSVFGQSVTFTATVTDNSPASTAVPTGSVQFVVDGVNFGSPVALIGATSTSSTATSQATTSLSVNGSPHTITANYINADGNFSTSTGSLIGGQRVTPAGTAIMVQSSLNPAIFGNSVTFTATVNNTTSNSTGAPTGSVQFVIDGTNFGAPAPVTPITGTSSSATSSATVTIPVSGSPHAITANYVNADGNYSNSNGTLPGGETITPASTSAAVVSSASTSVFGRQVFFTATITNSVNSSTGSPTGVVQFLIDGVNFGAPVSLNPATATTSTAISQSSVTIPVSGSAHVITAKYLNANGNFTDSNNIVSGGQTITPASTGSAAVSSSSTSIFGQSVKFTATVTNAASGSTGAPTGTVQFIVDGSNFGTPVTLAPTTSTSSTAVSSATSTLLVNGNAAHSVSVSYVNSDQNYSNSQIPLSGGQTVTPASTSSAISSATNVTNFLGKSVTLNSSIVNTALNSTAFPDASVQFLLDGANLGTSALTQGAVTSSGPQSNAAPFPVDLTKLGVGSHSIVASYNIDPNFKTSASSVIGITIANSLTNIPGQTINPVPIQFQGTGSNITFQCNVQLLNSAIPATTQSNFPLCKINATSGSLPTTITATITTLAVSSGVVKPAPSFYASNRPVAGFYALTTPLAGVLGLLLMGGRRTKYWSRRKLLTVLGMMLLLAVLGITVGCGGGFNNPNNLQPLTNGTQQGTYVVSVTATDSQGNVVAIGTIPLTVQL